MRRTIVPAAAAALALMATAVVAPASQAAPDNELATGLITPLSLAVADDGTVYVSQNFAGMLTKITGEGTETVYSASPGTEVGAVSVDGDSVSFATTSGPSEQNPTAKPGAHLWSLPAEGEATKVANLWRHERLNNPDGGRTYGIVGLTNSCQSKLTGPARHLRPYKGIQESHPYASTTVGDTTYVADAAANAVFAVTGSTVATEAVLPPTKVTVNKAIREAFGLPKCTDGKTYKVEPVPTDIEVAPDGLLYVTTLPGGPEHPAMGNNGAVYKIDPADGAVTKRNGGLTTPVGLAFAEDRAFVSMLFAGLILQAPFEGMPSPLDEAAFPGDVEYSNGKVYATLTDLTNDGSSPPAGAVVSWNLFND